MTVSVRLISPDDAAALAAIVRRSREVLAGTDPARDDDYYTESGQATIIEGALTEHQAGHRLPYVILDRSSQVVGRVALNEIVRGPLQSAKLGYFVDVSRAGEGLATLAAGQMLREAFGPMGLHRVEAGTLPDNHASQRVLAKNGFERFGYARKYLLVGGRWRDHILFQRLAEDSPERA